MSEEKWTEGGPFIELSAVGDCHDDPWMMHQLGKEKKKGKQQQVMEEEARQAAAPAPNSNQSQDDWMPTAIAAGYWHSQSTDEHDKKWRPTTN